MAVWIRICTSALPPTPHPLYPPPVYINAFVVTAKICPQFTTKESIDDLHAILNKTYLSSWTHCTGLKARTRELGSEGRVYWGKENIFRNCSKWLKKQTSKPPNYVQFSLLLLITSTLCGWLGQFIRIPGPCSKSFCIVHFPDGVIHAIKSAA